MIDVLVFGGQGASYVPIAACRGMVDVLESHPDLAPYADRDALEASTAPPDVVQPVLVAYQVISATHVIGSEGPPRCLLPQSLGELSAAVVASAVSLDDAIALARLRARLPIQTLPARAWTMTAVNGLTETELEPLVAGRDAAIAAINSPTDLVLSGVDADVAGILAAAHVPAARARPLPVVAPYHTFLMEPVVADFADAVESCSFSDPQLPILSPTLGDYVRSADDIRRALVTMLTQPVRWGETLRKAAQDLGQTFHDVGPKASLARFVAKNGLDLSWRSTSYEIDGG